MNPLKRLNIDSSKLKTLAIGFGAFVATLAVIYVLGRYGWVIVSWIASL